MMRPSHGGSVRRLLPLLLLACQTEPDVSDDTDAVDTDTQVRTPRRDKLAPVDQAVRVSTFSKMASTLYSLFRR